MRNRLLTLLLVFNGFFIHQLSAQNTIVGVDIVGPSYICNNYCDTLIFKAEIQNPSNPVPLGYAFKWTGPNNFIATGSTISFFQCDGQPFAPGTITFMVAVFSIDGVTVDTAFHTLTVAPFQPLTIYSSNNAPCNFDTAATDVACEKVCPNTTVTYYVDSNGGPGSTNGPNWQVTGASSYIVNTPFNRSVTVTWGGTGTGSVSVSSGQISGVCSGSDEICVTIVEEPQAHITADPVPVAGNLQVCKGQTVYFDNQSTGADSYEWHFSDDFTTSNASNPIHIFQNAGTFTVQLIARSACLCADTTFLTVNVLDAVSPGLDCVGTICPNETVTYTSTNACPPFNWSVTPNGTILNGGTATADSITIQWNSGPDGTITLGAQTCSGNTCPIPAVTHVPIIADNAEIVGAEGVCPSSEETYTIQPYGGTNFLWTLASGGTIKEGQGTNQVVVSWGDIPNPTLTHWLSVEYNNCYLGCGGSDSIGVQILSAFVINGPVEVCAGSSANFTSRLIYNGQNVPANWTLIAPDGSTAWMSTAPTAAPSVAFTSGAGIYRLSAVPNNPAQTCSAEAEWVIRVAALPTEPTAIVGARIICPGTPYTYEASGILPQNNLKWTVQNGPGAPTSAATNPLNVTWAATGPYSLAVAQVSANGLGCLSDTVRLDITPIGTMSIAGDPLACDDATGLYNLSTIQNIDIQWTITPLNAGTVANGQGSNAAEIFWTQPGTHTVSVAVCSQNAVLPVTVVALPQPLVQHPVGVCIGDAKPVQTTTPYATYSWRRDDGFVLDNAATLNLSGGSYSVQVSDANGCAGTAEFTIETYENPNLTISTLNPTGFCNNSLTVTITALTTNDGDFTYQWFQDGNPVGTNATTFSTNQYGNYTARATNQFGCTATAGPINVFQFCGGGSGGGVFLPGQGAQCNPGDVSFTIDPTPQCDSFQFHLVGGALYQPGTAFWRFGESGASLVGSAGGDDPTFVFPNASQYIVILTATLTNGATCEIIDSVKVAAAAQFDPSPTCLGDSTQFKDVSTFLPQYSITNWTWDFGDPVSGAGNISALINPAHLFGTAGDFTVQLTVTTSAGCTSKTTRLVKIPPATPPTFAPPAFKCAGNALAFSAVSNPLITQIAWDFGDPASGAANDATGVTAYHGFSAPGNYTVTATSTNAFGCEATFSQGIVVAPNPLTGVITPANPAPICEGKSVTLTAPAGGVSWIWSDSTTTTATLTVQQEGTYRVTITNADGCTYAPPPVKVEITPSPDALVKALLTNSLGQIIGTAYPTLAVCAGEDVHLQAQGAGGYGYAWSGSNGNTANVIFSTERGNLLTIGTYTYTVTVTDFASGCTVVTAPFIVTVNPVPSGFSISGVGGPCAGTPATLTYNGPTPANWQYIWNNGALGQTLVTEAAGVYNIRVINEFGCEAKSNDWVMLSGPPIAAIPAGCHTRCKPDTLCLPNLPDIVNWQWYYNGSAVPGATTPDFIAQQSGTYWAELTDTYGCTGQSDPLSLNLYDGYGNINGQIWSDVNNNGIIDPVDTLLPGFDVRLLNNGTLVGNGTSGANGGFAFTNILSTNYMVTLIGIPLPPNWQIVIGQAPVQLSGCDVTGDCDLLLHFQCQSVTQSATLQACPGQTASFNGTNILAGSSQTFSFTSALGCDSTIVVSVMPLTPTAGTLSPKVCPGSTYTYNGTAIPAGQTQQFIIPNAAGCDSTVTVTVGTLQPTTSTLSPSICPGTAFTYNGTAIPAGQTQQFIIPNAAGCDSTVTVTVGTLQPTASALSPNVCPGGVYLYNGTTIPAGQTQQFIIPNAAGCDSTVTVTVGTLQPTSSAVSVTICPGESYQYNGTALVAGQTTEFTIPNAAGCDSTITLSILEYNVVGTEIAATICPGTTYDFNGTVVPAGQTITFHLTTPQGCDSTVVVSITAFPALDFSTKTDNSCTATATGIVIAAGITGGLPPYQYSLDGTIFQDSATFVNLAAGDYTVYIADDNNCLFTEPATVLASPPLMVVLTNGILPCDSTGVQLTPVLSGDTTALTYTWWNGATTSTTVATDAGVIWVEATSHCETVRREASVQWADLAEDASFVYMPNVLMPTAKEPQNALFRPYFANGLTVLSYKFEIFDRWGDRLFATTDLNAGWEGIARAKEINPAVSVWYLEAQIAFCGRIITLKKQGDVTVVR